VLTEGQKRNGLVNPANRWPNKVVPYYIDPIFSEYCSTNTQIGLRSVEEIIHVLWRPLHLQYKLEVELMIKGDNYVFLIIKKSYTIMHVLTHVKPAM
jgi:hypothetical protein